MLSRPSAPLDGGDFGWLKAKRQFAGGRDGMGSLARWSSGNDDQLAPEKAYARVVFVTRARCR
jgi:hypothetical protein